MFRGLGRVLGKAVLARRPIQPETPRNLDKPAKETEGTGLGHDAMAAMRESAERARRPGICRPI